MSAILNLLFRGICVLTAAGVPMFASGINQIVSFGDSLSDTGNAAIATGGLYPGSNYATGQWAGAPPYPVLFTDGANTNPGTTGPGGLWVDQLAAKLGAPSPAPALVGGTNFAVASAESGFNSTFDVGSQVVAYGVSPLSSSAPGHSVFTFWAGANDLFNGSSGGAAAADKVTLDILYASATGADQFLWLNLPPLGDTPKGAKLNAAQLNAQSTAFNGEWQTDIYRLESLGISVEGVDVNSLFGHILSDQASGCTVGAADPYCFANVTDPAQGQNVNPNTYLFWDQQHPTTAADALIADLAYADLLAVPEPASAALLLAGAIAMVLTGRLRRTFFN